MGELLIVAGKADRARCKHCHASIVWVTTASQSRRPAGNVPLNGMPAVLRATENSHGIKFLVIDSRQRHRCEEFEQARAPRQRTAARDREASRSGQGRFW